MSIIEREMTEAELAASDRRIEELIQRIDGVIDNSGPDLTNIEVVVALFFAVAGAVGEMSPRSRSFAIKFAKKNLPQMIRDAVADRASLSTSGSLNAPGSESIH